MARVPSSLAELDREILGGGSGTPRTGVQSISAATASAASASPTPAPTAPVVASTTGNPPSPPPTAPVATGNGGDNGEATEKVRVFKRRHYKVYSPEWSYVLSSSILVGLTVAIWAILSAVSYFTVDTILNGWHLLGILVIVSMTLAKTKTVEEKYQAVPTRFGKRISSFVFTEGDLLLVRWFLDVLVANMQEKRLSVTKNDSGEPFHIICIDGEDKETRMFAKASVAILVADAYLSLETDRKTIDKSIADAVVDGARTFAATAKKTPIDLIKAKGELEKSVDKFIDEKFNVVDPDRTDIKVPVSDDPNIQYVMSRFGMDVQPIQITHLQPDPAVLDAEQQRTIEDAQRKSEDTNLTAQIEKAKRLMQADKTLTFPKAMEMVQLETLLPNGRQKISKIVIDTGESQPGMEKAAAMFAAAQLHGTGQPQPAAQPPKKGG